MYKILGLLALGLAACAAAFIYMRSEPATQSLLVTSADAQSLDVQKSLAALDKRVQELSATLQAMRDSPAGVVPQAAGRREDGEGVPGRGPDRQRFREGLPPEEMAAMREQFEKREAERISAAGLTPERFTSIRRRAEELRVAAMQAQYEAQRTGQRVEGMDVDQALRKELGDAEYERYLKAEGRPTEVRVMEVLATSAAERSGLKAGDEIVSYAGKRVFDNRDLNTLANQEVAGGSVVVEVKREGQTLRISVPAGPLGVTSGGQRGVGPGGGPPGGFPSDGGGRGGRQGGFRP